MTMPRSIIGRVVPRASLARVATLARGTLPASALTMVRALGPLTRTTATPAIPAPDDNA